MIYDVLDNSQLYEGIHKSLKTALAFLRSNDLAAMRVGRIDLEGDSIYVLVQEYMTKPTDQGKWEAHKRYIDVQYLMSGSERVGFTNIETMKLGTYNPERDFQPMTGDGQMIELSAGSFLILFPQDAHMPGLEMNSSSFVKKVVVKCLI
jgi:YhcH/YjgK/YiaL family protein